MKLRVFSVIAIVILVMLISACGNDVQNSELKKIPGEDLDSMLQSDEEMDGITLIDVRTPEEYNSGHLKNAVNIPLNLLEDNLSELGNLKKSPIIVICRSGNRSGQAQQMLINNEFTDVTNAEGVEIYDYKSITTTAFTLEK